MKKPVSLIVVAVGSLAAASCSVGNMSTNIGPSSMSYSPISGSSTSTTDSPAAQVIVPRNGRLETY